ncbi:MAG: magnesium transporter CorA family protein [Patescibacteria group bacterium]
MSVQIAKAKKLRWIYIERVGNRDIEYLRHNFNFHPLDLKDCSSKTQRPKIDVYPGYLFLVFHFPKYNREKRRVESQQLNIFIGGNYVATVSGPRLPVLSEYYLQWREKTSKGLKYDKLKNNSGYLLYKILSILFNESLPVVDILGLYINKAEEEVYSQDNRDAAREIAVVRRNVMNFRSILEPQNPIIDKLVNIKKHFISIDLSVYYDDIHDYLEKTMMTLNNYKEIINGLHDTNESMISSRTNETMKTLTVISVALLPLTLFASIYGMNISSLPFAEHPFGLWVLFGAMFVFIMVAIYISRRRNLI